MVECDMRYCFRVSYLVDSGAAARASHACCSGMSRSEGTKDESVVNLSMGDRLYGAIKVSSRTNHAAGADLLNLEIKDDM